VDRPDRLRLGVLTACAGFVDAVSFVTLFGLFTSHLSGDTTNLAVDLGRGHAGGDAGPRIAVLAAFVVAVITGTVLVVIGARPQLARRALLAAETVLLTGLMVLGEVWRAQGVLHLGSWQVAVLAATAGFAMGLQNAVVRSGTRTPVTTTFVTGALAAVGEDLAAWLRARADRDAQIRLRAHGIAWGAFLAGGVAGAAATTWQLWALALPAAVLLIVALAPQPTPEPEPVGS
jgi:uncharacterized membrane protein YoaK (UPF0700 family)